MFAAARTASDFRAYLDRGERHLAAAQQRLYRVSLDDAKARGSVTALRDWRRDYAGAPPELLDEARATAHALYAAALEQFRRAAGDRDPAALAFVERLVAYSEAHDGAQLEIRFRAPDVESLRKIDKILAKDADELRAPGGVARLEPHFAPHSAMPREASIAERLVEGFRQVFPSDMLELSHGPRLFFANLVDDAGIEVRYTVVPLVDDYDDLVIYREIAPDQKERVGRVYVGIEVRFEVTMRIPGADPYTLQLSVRPPEQFDVQGYEDIGDSDIYRAMADHAFAELHTKLAAAFFGADQAPIRR